MIAGPEIGCTTIAIGRVAVGIRTSDSAFLGLLEERYAGFTDARATPDFEFDIVLAPPVATSADADVRVFRNGPRWQVERGDFHAEWDPSTRRGCIRQSANPYSIDAVLRIVHTLVLAREGGFLMHSASAIRNGKAFLFAGISGSGKTTISRLAPDDVRLLTDEVSCVRREVDGYCVYGTPFAGELAKAGENLAAPLAAVYLLAKGSENRIEELSAADAARGLLANILFFAEDAGLVQAVFRAALDLAEHVPVRRLTFVPNARAWDLIQ